MLRIPLRNGPAVSPSGQRVADHPHPASPIAKGEVQENEMQPTPLPLSPGGRGRELNEFRGEGAEPNEFRGEGVEFNEFRGEGRC